MPDQPVVLQAGSNRFYSCSFFLHGFHARQLVVHLVFACCFSAIAVQCNSSLQLLHCKATETTGLFCVLSNVAPIAAIHAFDQTPVVCAADPLQSDRCTCNCTSDLLFMLIIVVTMNTEHMACVTYGDGCTPVNGNRARTTAARLHLCAVRVLSIV